MVEFAFAISLCLGGAVIGCIVLCAAVLRASLDGSPAPRRSRTFKRRKKRSR